jgi:hypothetical protein
MPKVALVNPRSLSVQLSDEARQDALSVPLDGIDDDDAADDNAALLVDEIRSHIWFGVLCRAIEERDQRLGITGRMYHISPPDPWLLVLGTVMWQGVVQGMSWDSVKYSVSAAMRKLRAARLAPPSKKSKSQKKGRSRIGFIWTDYAESKGRKELFLGLERVYRSKKMRREHKNLALTSRKAREHVRGMKKKR